MLEKKLEVTAQHRRDQLQFQKEEFEKWFNLEKLPHGLAERKTGTSKADSRT